MCSSVSRSMRRALFFTDMTDSPTSMLPCSLPLWIWGAAQEVGGETSCVGTWTESTHTLTQRFCFHPNARRSYRDWWWCYYMDHTTTRRVGVTLNRRTSPGREITFRNTCQTTALCFCIKLHNTCQTTNTGYTPAVLQSLDTSPWLVPGY